ncbi:hypothetical protein D1872_250140 [compost metagenome]
MIRLKFEMPTRIRIPQRIILHIRIQVQGLRISNIPFIRILTHKAPKTRVKISRPRERKTARGIIAEPRVAEQVVRSRIVQVELLRFFRCAELVVMIAKRYLSTSVQQG